jgi:hypothetical protein
MQMSQCSQWLLCSLFELKKETEYRLCCGILGEKFFLKKMAKIAHLQ